MWSSINTDTGVILTPQFLQCNRRVYAGEGFTRFKHDPPLAPFLLCFVLLKLLLLLLLAYLSKRSVMFMYEGTPTPCLENWHGDPFFPFLFFFRKKKKTLGNCMIFKIKYNFVILELIGQPYFQFKWNNSKTFMK